MYSNPPKKQTVIVIASGKGGTGKTTIATNLASVAGDLGYTMKLLDCDVEEPNCHLFLSPVIDQEKTVTIPVPSVDDKLCMSSGRCGEVCQFNAIVMLKDRVLVFPELCHGCGACSYLCPNGAISEIPRQVGVVEIGRAKGIEFVQGRLNVAEPMSPPVISAVKRHIKGTDIVIIDSPPGSSCPLVETLKGVDFCLLVTEPTPFGLHDLDLAVRVCKKMKIGFGIVINRSDIGDDGVIRFCKGQNVPILAEFVEDRRVAEIYCKGELITEKVEGYKEKFQKLFRVLFEIIESQGNTESTWGGSL